MAADKANRTECRRSSALSGRFEDWGWELPAIQGSNSYYLGMSGNSDESSTNKDEGEWRIIVGKKRSFPTAPERHGENRCKGRNGEDD